MEQKKALIAMSGGVDSSVAAYLMQRDGYACIGATMRLIEDGLLPPAQQSSCCSLDDVEDARAVARKLGFPYYVFNFTQDFRRQVVDKFAESYAAGLTPNPCMDCNRHLKFDRLLRRALELGCDCIATGHYARIKYDPGSGRYLLCKGLQPEKDQSYFLACLTQAQLARTRFPLGTLTKAQVREIAEAQGLCNAKKHDSQDICFVPDGDYRAFLARYTGAESPPGDFLDLQGHVVGRHNGATGYTIGQRKGLGLAMGAPVYVCAKDMAANTVTVGPNQALYRKALLAKDWVFYPFEHLTQPLRVFAKTRSRQVAQSALAIPEADGVVRVRFDEPQRAITPGQAVVLYDGDTVLGGGTITQAVDE